MHCVIAILYLCFVSLPFQPNNRFSEPFGFPRFIGLKGNSMSEIAGLCITANSCLNS